MEKANTEAPRALRPKDVRTRYGISRTKLYDLIKEGKVHSVAIGRMRLVSTDSLEALIRGEAA